MSKKQWSFLILIAVAGIMVYVLARLEILKRAGQEAALARTYYYNSQHLDERNKKLAERFASKEITEEAYKFLSEEDILFAEDGLKGSLVAWQTVVEDFSPPHSRFVDEAFVEIFKISDLYFQKKIWLLAHDGYDTLTRYAAKNNGLPKTCTLSPADLALCQTRLTECEAQMWPPEKKKKK